MPQSRQSSLSSPSSPRDTGVSLLDNLATLVKMVQETPLIVLTAKVLSVDVEAGTCVVLPQDEQEAAELVVRLRASVDQSLQDQDAGWLLVPKIGSIVSVALLDGLDETAVLVATTNLQRTTYSGSLIVNNGDNGGLVNITPLHTWMQQITTLVNQLAAQFAVHAHPANGSPPTGAQPPEPVQTPELTSLEDSKVTH